MKTHSLATWKGLTASVTSAVLVALSVVVPLLDGERGLDGPVFESEHHTPSCVVGHHHTVCTQFGANLALTPVAPAPVRSLLRVRPLLPPRPADPATRPLDQARLPRAPPFLRA